MAENVPKTLKLKPQDPSSTLCSPVESHKIVLCVCVGVGLNEIEQRGKTGHNYSPSHHQLQLPAAEKDRGLVRRYQKVSSMNSFDDTASVVSSLFSIEGDESRDSSRSHSLMDESLEDNYDSFYSPHEGSSGAEDSRGWRSNSLAAAVRTRSATKNMQGGAARISVGTGDLLSCGTVDIEVLKSSKTEDTVETDSISSGIVAPTTMVGGSDLAETMAFSKQYFTALFCGVGDVIESGGLDAITMYKKISGTVRSNK